MASVELFLGKDEGVPGVCLCCGEATKQVYPTRFILFWGKTLTLQAPLCSLHRNHFRWRSWMFSAGMIASIIPVMVALAVLVARFGEANPDVQQRILQVLGFSGLWFLGLVVLLVFLRASGIRLSGTESGKVKLLNVAPEYAEALRVLRQERMKMQTLASSHFFVNVQSLQELTEEAGPLADDARRVLELAGIYARAFQHDYVGTDHLLLGLRRVEVGVAGQVLKNCLLPEKLAEIEVQNITAPVAETPSQLPVTPQLKKTLQNAWEEARARNHAVLSTAHILLGLLRQDEGVGAHVLETFGLDREDVRKQALKFLLQMDIAFFAARERGPGTPSSEAISTRPPS